MELKNVSNCTRTSLNCATTYFIAVKLFNWHKVPRAGRLIKLLLCCGSNQRQSYRLKQKRRMSPCTTYDNRPSSRKFKEKHLVQTRFTSPQGLLNSLSSKLTGMITVWELLNKSSQHLHRQRGWRRGFPC